MGGLREFLRDPRKLIIYGKIHGLSSIERSPELLRGPGELIIYCKKHGRSSTERSPELLLDLGHGLSSIEWFPELPQDPEGLWNYHGVRATVFTMFFVAQLSRNIRIAILSNLAMQLALATILPQDLHCPLPLCPRIATNYYYAQDRRIFTPPSSLYSRMASN